MTTQPTNHANEARSCAARAGASIRAGSPDVAQLGILHALLAIHGQLARIIDEESYGVRLPPAAEQDPTELDDDTADTVERPIPYGSHATRVATDGIIDKIADAVVARRTEKLLRDDS